MVNFIIMLFSWSWCQYPQNSHNLNNNFPFFPERMKIEKVQKLVENVNDKEETDIHIGNLKQALNHWLV